MRTFNPDENIVNSSNAIGLVCSWVLQKCQNAVIQTVFRSLTNSSWDPRHFFENTFPQSPIDPLKQLFNKSLLQMYLRTLTLLQN